MHGAAKMPAYKKMFKAMLEPADFPRGIPLLRYARNRRTARGNALLCTYKSKAYRLPLCVSQLTHGESR